MSDSSKNGQELEKALRLIQQLRHENYVLLEQLKSKDGILKLILSRLDVICGAIGPDKTIDYLVGKGLDIFNINIGDVLGRSIYDAIHSLPELISFLEKSLEGEPLEQRIKLGDSNVYEISSFPVKDEKDSLIYTFVIAVPV